MNRIFCAVVVGLALGQAVRAEPALYTDETTFVADLVALAGSTVVESFEDDATWAASRNSIVAPGRTPSVASQGLVWTSNHPGNELATGTVGGSAPGGAFAIYSLPHGLTTDSGLYCDSAEDPDIPIECFQDDGLTVVGESGATLYAFGGRIDTANGGKVTFLLDGIDINGNDTDNIDNWQREGDPADQWAFVGVIDAAGFASVELRELRGKDFQQVLLFADEFTIRRAASACGNGLDDDGDGRVDFAGLDPGCTSAADPSETEPGLACDNGSDDDGDGGIDYDPLTAADPSQGTGDPGCLDPAWPLEDPQCQDGLDNDGRPGIDFDGGASANGGVPLGEPDPECVGKPASNREAAAARACGLGAELSLLLPAILAVRRRPARPRLASRATPGGTPAGRRR
ncbi:MAG: hypothetical protein JRH10_05800 [Deltaproteobacteria bacterium]|nr:hypothetical protein [Deltaproteobacteria bacterium]MBW2446218.1 hypothetical protein [Deltaproteobacteria bacterium]